MTKKGFLTVTLKETVVEKARKQAKLEKRSLSNLIEIVLDYYLEKSK